MREAYRNEATPCVHCQDESFAGVRIVTDGMHQIRLKEKLVTVAAINFMHCIETNGLEMLHNMHNYD